MGSGLKGEGVGGAGERCGGTVDINHGKAVAKYVGFGEEGGGWGTMGVGVRGKGGRGGGGY